MSSIVENGAEWGEPVFRGSDGVPALPDQWRAKVTRFRSGGFEVTASLVDRDRARESWERTQGFGVPVVRCRRQEGELSEDDKRRAVYRARRRVRHVAVNLAVTHLLTLTTREAGEYRNREAILAAWDRFLRLYQRATGRRLEFIRVIEQHPTNPDHLHLHVAIRSFIAGRVAGRLWHLALGGDRACQGGAEWKGYGHCKPVPIRATLARRRSTMIAGYISKYLTKDLVEVLNKKRFTTSHGAGVGIEVDGFWLAAATRFEALVELFRLFPGLRAHPADFFLAPGERRVWARCVDGDASGHDPPF